MEFSQSLPIFDPFLRCGRSRSWKIGCGRTRTAGHLHCPPWCLRIAWDSSSHCSPRCLGSCAIDTRILRGLQYVTVKMVKSLLRRTNWRIGESECLDLFSHTFNLLQAQVNTQRCVMHPFAVLLCNQMYFTCSLIFILHHVQPNVLHMFIDFHPPT